MGDIILFLFIIAAITTAWVEWLPRKYDIVIGVIFSITIIGIGIGWIPRWYGWVVALIGVGDLAWHYRKGVRAFGWPQPAELLSAASQALRASAGFIASSVEGRREPDPRPREPERAVPTVRQRLHMPHRVWIGSVALTALSPIAAIPATVLLAVVITLANILFADPDSIAISVSEVMRSVLGHAFMILVATLDLVIRGFVVTVPFFLATGIGGARWADRSDRYWRRLAVASLLIGALYPLIFAIGGAIGWFDEPFFN